VLNIKITVFTYG